MQKPSIGRIVLYVLCQEDCDAIEANRARMAELLQISSGQIGNSVRPGDIVPAVILRAWSDTCINAQALLDGFDTLWLMSRSRDDAKARKSWHWPEIERPVSARVESMPGAPGQGVQIDGQGLPPVADSISRIDAELSAGKRAGIIATLSQLELKARRLCAHIETLGASPELTRASVEAANIRTALEHLIEDRPIAFALRDWLEGR